MKKMTYRQAYNKLCKIAGDKPCTASIKWWKFSSGMKEKEYELYIENHAHFIGRSWEEAFEKLEKEIK